MGVWQIVMAATVTLPIVVVIAFIAYLVYCDAQNQEFSFGLPSRQKRRLRNRQHQLKMIQLDIAEDQLLHDRMKGQTKQLS